MTELSDKLTDYFWIVIGVTASICLLLAFLVVAPFLIWCEPKDTIDY